MRLLAINFGGLGDEVLYLPTLQSIRQEHPDWHITLLTEPRAKSIFDLTDLVDDMLTFDIKKRPLGPGDCLELLQLLRSGKFDAVVSSGGSLPVSVLLFLSGIKTRVGYVSGKLSKILLTGPVPLKREQYAGWMYHDLVSGLGIRRSAEPPQVKVKSDAVERMSALLSERWPDLKSKPLVVAHPGTSRLAVEKGIIKTWDVPLWSEFILRLIKEGNRVVLAGGPDDKESVAAIDAQIKATTGQATTDESFFNAYGKTAGVADLAALLGLADLIVCVDSAPMHIGAGLDRPMVALFGPTDPARLLLQNDHIRALRNPDASSEGVLDGINRSVRGVQIPVDTVFQTAMDLLKRGVSQGSSRESRLQ